MSQLMLNGEPIAGGGLSVVQMTEAQYLANKTALDSSDILVMITDVEPSVADGESVIYDSDMNFENIGNIATKAIAKVEPSNTALYLHEVGTGFINKDGNYCITDVQIPVNGTITLGTNCHVVDGGISSNLNDIIKKQNVTVSTDANGVGIMGTFSLDDNGYIVSAYRNSGEGYVVIPYIKLSGGVAYWFCKILREATFNPLANDTTTVTIVYVPKDYVH